MTLRLINQWSDFLLHLIKRTIPNMDWKELSLVVFPYVGFVLSGFVNKFGQLATLKIESLKNCFWNERYFSGYLNLKPKSEEFFYVKIFFFFFFIWKHVTDNNYPEHFKLTQIIDFLFFKKEKWVGKVYCHER